MPINSDYIDFTKTYKVEPKLANGDTIGLAKEGLSRMPGTVRGFCVSYNPQTRKYQTGLDEFAPEVTSLPDEEREVRIKWIKDTVKSLEQAIGEPGILNPKNDDFWSVWTVDIETAQDRKTILMGSHPRFLPEKYWQHKLALITLKVGGEIPFSKSEGSDPKYKNAQFYITTPEEINTLSKERSKKSRKRAVEIEKLFPSEGGKGDFDRAWTVAYLLGVQKEVNVSYEKLEETLDLFSAQEEYLPKFLKLCSLSNAELEVQKVIKQACDYSIITYRPEDKLYFRGGRNFRDTEDNTIEYFNKNLAEADVAREFAEIKALVNKRVAQAKK